ncbi:MAG: Cupin region [Enterovirga sp.]|jgi:quercetin dioxygenase-like cupin family protein|nr:Cupin region [Enterovirga sp.]
MDIFPASKHPSRRVNPDWFTGAVWQDPIVEAPAPARIRAARVAFEPGARTNWHTHPLGQTLHVVQGIGLVQKEGEPIQTIRAGDSVWIPPNERHWHGAAPTHGMVHIAMHEFDGEKHVTWLEPVTDEQYGAAPAV